MQPEQKQSNQQFGPIFGIIIVVVILVAGSIYLLRQQIDHPQSGAAPEDQADATR